MKRLLYLVCCLSISLQMFAQSEISKAELHTFFNATFPQCLELLVAKIFENDAKNRS